MWDTATYIAVILHKVHVNGVIAHDKERSSIILHYMFYSHMNE